MDYSVKKNKKHSPQKRDLVYQVDQEDQGAQVH